MMTVLDVLMCGREKVALRWVQGAYLLHGADGITGYCCAGAVRLPVVVDDLTIEEVTSLVVGAISRLTSTLPRRYRNEGIVVWNEMQGRTQAMRACVAQAWGG